MQGYNYNRNLNELPAYLNFSSQTNQTDVNDTAQNSLGIPDYLAGISGVTVYQSAQDTKVSEVATDNIGVNPQDLSGDKKKNLEDRLKESISAFRDGQSLEEDNSDLALDTGLPELPSPDQLTPEQKSYIEKMILSGFNKTYRD